MHKNIPANYLRTDGPWKGFVFCKPGVCNLWKKRQEKLLTQSCYCYVKNHHKISQSVWLNGIRHQRIVQVSSC